MALQLSDTIRRRLPILFALVMGTLAVVFMQQYLAGQHRLLAQERARLLQNYQDPIKVLVVSKDLPAGTTLEAGLLELADVPEKFVQPYAARTPRDILGLVTAVPLAKGEQVLMNKLRRPDEAPTGSTLAGLTPEGKRAVTIGVDAITGVGGFVRPGDEVDVLWTLKLPGAGEDGQIVMLTLFQKVTVLAVGGQMAGRPPVDESQQAPRDYTVTLALSPQETAFLLFAREQGRIQLSLRPKKQGESQELAVPPTNINTLLEAKLGIKASPPPRPARQVEVYKGLKRDVVVMAEEE
ncbi:MAG: Flp pilus assembly protein CpaB [Omnitrophica WOR_2 bacterium RIFCSPHIGHO2_02_FULL_68_15]|nr:MAG: Flp pilus assembly protein CpaB [Omnitrophica WOR_2 bacterium RIFCSPHIGHO2_02_FULL_68_15]